MRKLKIVFAAMAMAFAASAQATILSFDQDPPVTDFENVSQVYGDRVTSVTMPGNYLYGVGAEGFTPNVVVAYQGWGSSPGGVDPALWTRGYGTLVNVLFEDADFNGHLEILLTADSGFVVTLHEIQMAAYSSAFADDPIINLLTVLDAGDNVLYSSPDLIIAKDTFSHFGFKGVSSTALKIRFDSSNLLSLSDDIAIDNIRFSQTAVTAMPTPATGWLFVAGLLGLMGFARQSSARRVQTASS